MRCLSACVCLVLVPALYAEIRLEIEPAGGSTITSTTPQIRITYASNAAPLDLSSLSIAIDGADQTRLFTIRPNEAVYSPALTGGDHVVQAAIRDSGGASASAASRFRISVFRVIAEASVTRGVIPLSVTFQAHAEYTEGSIIRYRWDWEGDGTFDSTLIGVIGISHSYRTIGTFRATVEALNDKNQTATAVIPITVLPNFNAVVDVEPSNGPVPLSVRFSAFVPSTGRPNLRYEWDADGNGAYEFSGANGTYSYTYTAPGVYTAKLRVTDSDGNLDTAQLTVRAGPAGSPTARINSPGESQRMGNVPFTVQFRGSGTPRPGIRITRFEWDFDGDGVYDSSSAGDPNATFQYKVPGVYHAAFRVTDSQGLTAIDTLDIVANLGSTFSIGNDTCRADQGQRALVNTTLTGPATVTLMIKDRSGQTVRTLVPAAVRQAGAYTDAWDCLDDTGRPVKDDAYYAVLQYPLGGEVRTPDPTGATQLFAEALDYTMSGGALVQNSRVFKPYQNDFLTIDFNLKKASLVSDSIRYLNATSEVTPIFTQKAFSKGPHRIFWEGSGTNGNIVTPAGNDLFIFGLTRFDLPANAIVAESAPVLSNVAVTPNYFDPSTGNFISPDNPVTTLAFTTSTDSTVTLQVTRAGANRLVRTLAQAVPAGSGSFQWDGRDDAGIFVEPGDYRLAVKAFDPSGNQSLVRYAFVKVFY